jgi:hypothetical protein
MLHRSWWSRGFVFLALAMQHVLGVCWPLRVTLRFEIIDGGFRDGFCIGDFPDLVTA